MAENDPREDLPPWDYRNTATNDQAISWMVENYPALWWGLYKGNLDKGFDPIQSLSLLMCYIQSVHRRV